MSVSSGGENQVHLVEAIGGETPTPPEATPSAKADNSSDPGCPAGTEEIRHLTEPDPPWLRLDGEAQLGEQPRGYGVLVKRLPLVPHPVRQFGERPNRHDDAQPHVGARRPTDENLPTLYSLLINWFPMLLLI